MEYGLLGKVLAHSFSPEIHSLIGDYGYELYELIEEEVEAFLKERNFKAVNVTIPYKQTVIPFLDEIGDCAKNIGAVNTIVNKDNRLWGYNTDFDGLRALVLSLIQRVDGLKAVILGFGGTSRTAQAVLKSLNIGEVLVVSRRGETGSITYEELAKKHRDADIIINTTPCGMYPETDKTAIDITKFKNLKAVCDVVYNPLRTELVMQARAMGVKAEGGLYMLVMQAVKASELFFNRRIEPEQAQPIFNTVKKRRENIVLTGMPSSGKTTVGTILSKETGRKLIDVDQLIVEKAGCEISEIFTNRGEEYFRQLEAEVIRTQVAPLTGVIIATGGGAVLREENVKNLKKNGKLCFLDRDLQLLTPTASRPTAADTQAMRRRYEERYEIYKNTADCIISANDEAEIVAKRVKEEFLK